MAKNKKSRHAMSRRSRDFFITLAIAIVKRAVDVALVWRDVERLDAEV